MGALHDMSRAQLSLLAPVSPLEPTPGEDVAYTPVSRAHAIVRSLLPDLGPYALVCDPHAMQRWSPGPKV